jgi:N-acetylglucosamine transport system permease protein
MHHHKYRLIVPFMFPALLLYGVFVLYPYAQAIYLSLTSWRGLTKDKPWVGLDNYRALWHDQRFMEDLGRNGRMLIVLPLFTIGIALLFAALFTQGKRSVPGAGFYRIVFFFPQIISTVIVAILWSYVYTPNIGLLNGALGAVGLKSLQQVWLGDERLILWSIAAVAIWTGVGFYMVIYMAAMQSIPDSFYEAATLDGASRWRSFRDITLPLIWETVRTTMIYIGIGALDLFALVQVMTGGGSGTGRKAEVASLYMYNRAFTRSLWGYAPAIGVVLLVLTLLLSLVIMRVTKRETYEF